MLGAVLYATIPPFLAGLLPALALKLAFDLGVVRASQGRAPRPAMLERVLGERAASPPVRLFRR
jgi:hypothetical protein